MTVSIVNARRPWAGAVVLTGWGLIAAACGGTDETSSPDPGGTSGSDGGPGGAQGGVDASAGGGGSAGDGGFAAGGAGGAPPNRWDGGVQPKTLLHAGDGITLHGVTSDGFVIYFSEADSTLRAVPYWGGTSEVIYPGGPRVSIRGRTVFAAPSATAAVPFTVWMHGMKPLRIPDGPVSNSVYGVDYAAMTDPEGERIVFTRDVGGVLHWIGANIDLTNEVDLGIAGVGMWAKAYYAGGYFVTTSGVSGTTGDYALDSWDVSWKRTNHYSGPGLNLTYDGVQVAGDRILYTEGLMLEWATPGATTATTVASSVYDFVTSADGEWVAYYDYLTGSFTSAVGAPAPAPLEISVQGGDVVFSPDNAYVATSASSAGARYASVANGVEIELTPGSDSDLLDGGFTRDSRYVLYAAEDLGILAVPVDGEPAIPLAPLRSFTRPHLRAAFASRVVYVNQDTKQLLARDLASIEPPAVLSAGTDYSSGTANPLAMTVDGESVVYVVNEGDEQHGLYAIGVP